jgi:xanthine/CO dehydrogenase XdhC/CoxF family maturation factor
MKDLQQILDALQSAPAGGAVLATLVQVEGSSYRRPGARLLVIADGRRFGSISGGCLEDDVVQHAQEVFETGWAKMITYDTTTENDLVWGVGLGCNGVVHVLVEKLPPQPVWVAALVDNFRQRKPTELAVLWQSPDPTQLGTRLAAELAAAPKFPDGAGFQPAAITQAGMPARYPKPLSAQNTEMFRQVIPPPVPLVIFGAGDDARPLVRMAKELGWHVTVVDPRPAFAKPERFPEADAVLVAHPEEVPAGVAHGADTLVVIMTHHYRHDLPLLRALLPRPLAYLGLLGPRKRAEKILADLAAQGFAATPEMRLRLHAPVGLDLGADNPEEVALAILAEMKASLAGRDGRPLRERVSPIHS